MSDFSLKLDPLNGIIDKFCDISNDLSSAQSQLNAQAGKLSGMSGFGIPQIQAAINNLGRDLARLSGDTNAIASFVGELQSIVTNYENKAVIALGGEDGDSIDVGMRVGMPAHYQTESDSGLHSEPHLDFARRMTSAVEEARSIYGDDFLQHLDPDIKRDLLFLTGAVFIKRDLSFLTGDVFNGVDFKARFKILKHMHDNNGQITFDDLVRFGVYNYVERPSMRGQYEQRRQRNNVLRNANRFISLVCLEFRMSRQGTTINQMELEWQQQRAAAANEILKTVAKEVKP